MGNNAGDADTFAATWQKPPFCPKLLGLGQPLGGWMTVLFGGARIIASYLFLKGSYHAPHDH